MSNQLDNEILITDLEENLADDPYGTAMFAVRNVLHRALKNSGLMNPAEHRDLVAIEEFITTRTNEPPMVHG